MTARPRILAIDVGTGTQDILVLEAGAVIENAVQLIMPSPTALLAERIKQATQDRVDLVLTGVTMGGGPDHWAVEAHLRAGLRVFATPNAARTFDDDLDRVAAMGVRIVDSAEGANGARRLELRDFYLAELMQALRAFGVSTVFDAVAVAVFDHGAAPPGVSDRRFRFDYLRDQVERGIGLEGFGFLAAEIPARMTRMQAVAGSWTGSEPLFLMDTGPAAILGALDDVVVAASDPVIVLNLGNFHTIAALLADRRILGLFEHHTGQLTQPTLELYLDALATGSLSNDQLFDDMGHGALELGPVKDAPQRLAVTGPRRAMLDGSRLKPHLAVPHGDMMLAGCFGLLRALAAQLPDFAPVINDQLGAPAQQR
ncbi:MAG: pyruvate formate lyase-activating protein [Chloroflexi bacterium]|nr:MAG: pyruvate formate lyase-activating protein [Chloroflexota bacterium]